MAVERLGPGHRGRGGDAGRAPRLGPGAVLPDPGADGAVAPGLRRRALRPAPMGWGTWTTGNRPTCWRSPLRRRCACASTSAGSFRTVPFGSLAADWPNYEWWLAINPGLPIEAYLPSWFVTQLTRGDVRLPGRTMGARARMTGRVTSPRLQRPGAGRRRPAPAMTASPVAPPPSTRAGAADSPAFGSRARRRPGSDSASPCAGEVSDPEISGGVARARRSQDFNARPTYTVATCRWPRSSTTPPFRAPPFSGVANRPTGSAAPAATVDAESSLPRPRRWPPEDTAGSGRARSPGGPGRRRLPSRPTSAAPRAPGRRRPTAGKIARETHDAEIVARRYVVGRVRAGERDRVEPVGRGRGEQHRRVPVHAAAGPGSRAGAGRHAGQRHGRGTETSRGRSRRWTASATSRSTPRWSG